MLLLKGILCGIGAAAPIGPVNVEIARRALRAGFWPAVALGCGAVTIDLIYCTIAAFGVVRLSGNTWIYWPVTAVGVAVLSYLGMMSLRQARSVGRTHRFEGLPKPTMHGGYVVGLLMTAGNPMTLAFWFTVLPAMAGSIVEQPRRDLPIICLGVFLGTLGWVLSFAGLLSFAGRHRQPWWLIAADEIGGTMLLVLAAAMLLRVASGPL